MGLSISPSRESHLVLKAIGQTLPGEPPSVVGVSSWDKWWRSSLRLNTRGA